jgi:Phage gp6-like head-tail connector protein
MSGPTIIPSTLVAATPLFGGGKTYDLIDLTTVKTLLNVTSTFDDAFLSLAITQASGAIRRYCSRTFQPQFYQDQFWAQRDAYPWEVPGSFMPLQLKNFPIMGSASPAGTAPPAAVPTVSSVAGGSLAAQTYYVRQTYVTATGETAASLENFVIVAANKLLSVASPPPDPLGLATGWNVYVSNTSSAETLQNASPITIGTSWTESSSGLIAGTALPQYILAIENIPNVNLAVPNTAPVPTALNEGVDFIADRGKGQLTLFFTDGYPRHWPALPIIVQYWAGYTATGLQTDVPELQDACVRLVKSAYYGRARDPKLRSENVVGAYEAAYWFANGPGAEGDLPPDVQQLVDDHRVPVIA